MWRSTIRSHRRRKRAAYEEKLADVTTRESTMSEVRSALLEQPYREVLLAEKYKKFPANVQAAIATPEASALLARFCWRIR